MYYVPLAVQCTYECSDERGEDGNVKERREWVFPSLLYTDDLVLGGV